MFALLTEIVGVIQRGFQCKLESTISCLVLSHTSLWQEIDADMAATVVDSGTEI